MFFSHLLDLFSSLICLFLHVTGGGTFPKALSAAEEKECLEQMAQGSETARRKLIEHNLRLVAHIIKNGSSKRKGFRIVIPLFWVVAKSSKNQYNSS